MSAIPQDIMAAAAAAHADFARSTVRDNLTLIIARAIMAERQRSSLLPAQTEPDAGRVEVEPDLWLCRVPNGVWSSGPEAVRSREAMEDYQARGYLIEAIYAAPHSPPREEIEHQGVEEGARG